MNAVEALVQELAGSGRQVYVDGAVAHLVDSGLSASDARSAVAEAIDAGILRQRGTMVQAAERDGVFDAFVHRVGKRWVVARKTPGGFSTLDTRSGKRGEKIAPTLKGLVQKGAKTYTTRTRAEAGVAKTYFDVPVRVAAESCGCTTEAANAIMAEEKLTSAQRAALPDSAFAFVDRRKNIRLFPVMDAQHAKSAMGLLNTWYPRGHFTDSQYEAIRSRILRAYDDFGLTSRAPSRLSAPRMAAERSTALGLAAEPAAARETQLALDKAQRREIAMRNLKKAWAAQGRGTGNRNAKKIRYPGPRTSPEAKTTSKRQAYERLAMAWAAQGRDPTPMVEKARALGSTKAAPKINGKATKSKPRASTSTASRRPKPKARPAQATSGGKRTARVPSGKYISPKTGTMISIRRVYPRKNPMMEFTAVTGAVAGAGFVGGLVVSSWVDRWIATMPPKDSNDPKIGMVAARAIQGRSDATRMGVQFLGTALFGLGAYLGRDYPTVMAGSAGVALAFGTRLLSQFGSSVIGPLFFKAESSADKGFSNRYYPDLQDWAQPGTTAAIDQIGTGSRPRPRTQTVSFGGKNGVNKPGMRGLPPVPPGLPVATTGVGSGPKPSDVGVGGCSMCASNCASNCGGSSCGEKRFANMGGGCRVDLPPGDTNGDENGKGDEDRFTPRLQLELEEQPAEMQMVEGTEDAVGTVLLPDGSDGGESSEKDRRVINLADVVKLAARRPDRVSLGYPQAAVVR